MQDINQKWVMYLPLGPMGPAVGPPSAPRPLHRPAIGSPVGPPIDFPIGSPLGPRSLGQRKSLVIQISR